MPSCPSLDTLRTLGSGSHHDAIDSVLDAHINGCDACQSALDRLLFEEEKSTIPGSPLMPGPDNFPVIPGLTIVREIGRGGMGVVYLAWDSKLARHVALKIVPGGPTTGTRERALWLREAQSAAKVRHPHIVQLYQVGEAGPWLYLVLEFIQGGSLDKRLLAPLPPRDAARLLEAVSSAIHEVHNARLLHLDLKPSNILLDGGPNAPWNQISPKVSDFGIARPWGEPDASSTTLPGPRGTPSYMAPEQVNADRPSFGPHTDVYALGAILYELLTGHPPFQAPSLVETLDRVRDQEPASPRTLNSAIPRDLDTICLKCLQKNPAKRYPSANDLTDDLRLWLDGHPIKARPVSPPERAYRWCRRRPVVAALTATLALTLSAAFLITLLLWRRAEADFQTTNEVLSQIVLQNLEAANISFDHSGKDIQRLEQTRKRFLAVVERRPDHLESLRNLATMDRILGHLLAQADQLDQARIPLIEALHYFDRVLHQNPLDPSSLAFKTNVFQDLADIADRQQRPDECLGYLRRAVDTSEKLERSPSGSSIWGTARIQNALAASLARHGDHEEARSMIAASRQWLQNVRPEAETIELAAWRIFVFWDFDRSTIRSDSTPNSVSQIDDSSYRDPLSAPTSPDADHLTSKEWAVLALQNLLSVAHPDIPSSDKPEGGQVLLAFMSTMAAEQRHSNKLDEAGRTAARMLALARLLVERHPNQPHAHVALSQAYSQIYKNAWRVEDREAVERNLRLALEAAQRAQALHPDNGLALTQVTRLQRGLKDLLSPE